MSNYIRCHGCFEDTLDSDSLTCSECGYGTETEADKLREENAALKAEVACFKAQQERNRAALEYAVDRLRGLHGLRLEGEPKALDNSRFFAILRGGEGYEKCKTICQQPGHAEEMAIKRANEAGISLDGAVALVVGHEYICGNCKSQLHAAGVLDVEIAQ